MCFPGEEMFAFKADVYPCQFLIVTASVPHFANAMPIHVDKTSLYTKIIQFDEERIQFMRVTYKAKVFSPYKRSVLFVGDQDRMPQNAVSDQALHCLHAGCVKEMMKFIIRMSGSALSWRIETGQIFSQRFFLVIHLRGRG